MTATADLPLYWFLQQGTLFCTASCIKLDKWGLVSHNTLGNPVTDSQGGWGGNSHMKGAGMLVVSLRGVNFGFWSHLWCSGQNAIIFSREGLI